MMEKLKYTKFKTLLISSFICISIIPVVLLGLFIFHLSKQELIRQSEKQMWQNAENVSDILDEKLDYIEEFSLKINVDTRIYKIFQNLDTSDSMQLEMCQSGNFKNFVGTICRGITRFILRIL